MSRITIIGGGAFGTALACVARRNGADTMLWARSDAIVASINRGDGNPDYLPGITLEPGITATTDITAAISGADAILLVTPAQFMRATTAQLAGAMKPDSPVVICAKGIEQQSGALMTEVAAETLPGHKLAVLSGPTFAAEVARGLPTAVTLACEDDDAADMLVAAAVEIGSVGCHLIGPPELAPDINADDRQRREYQQLIAPIEFRQHQ